MNPTFKSASEKANIMKIVLCCTCWLYLTSCGRTECPGFPEHLVDYFPYKNGDTLSFVNQHNDTISFQVSGVSITNNNSIPKCGKCACDPPVFSFRAPKLKQGTGLEGLISLYGYPSIPCVKLEISSDYWNPDLTTTCLYSSLIFLERTGKDPFDSKNSALFGETVILDILECDDQQISKVTVIKGKGITSFYDQIYKFQWKSINN